MTNINYSTEASSGSVGTFQSGSSAVAVPPTFTRYYGAEDAAGILELMDNTNGASYGLNIPNVFKVVVNTGRHGCACNGAQLQCAFTGSSS